MIRAIQNLYVVEDLPGENLLRPLKGYQRFFAKKMDQKSGLAKLALRVGNVASSLLAYPVLGFLAAIGMLVKLTGLPDIRSKNGAAKSHIQVIRTGIQAARVFDDEYSRGHASSQLHALDIKEYQVTRQNVDTMCSSIQRQIDTLTKQFQKVYLKSKGHIENGQGEIKVTLRIYQRA